MVEGRKSRALLIALGFLVVVMLVVSANYNANVARSRADRANAAIISVNRARLDNQHIELVAGCKRLNDLAAKVRSIGDISTQSADPNALALIQDPGLRQLVQKSQDTRLQVRAAIQKLAPINCAALKK